MFQGQHTQSALSSAQALGVWGNFSGVGAAGWGKEAASYCFYPKSASESLLRAFRLHTNYCTQISIITIITITKIDPKNNRRAYTRATCKYTMYVEGRTVEPIIIVTVYTL